MPCEPALNEFVNEATRDLVTCLEQAKPGSRIDAARTVLGEAYTHQAAIEALQRQIDFVAVRTPQATQEIVDSLGPAVGRDLLLMYVVQQAIDEIVTYALVEGLPAHA